MDLEKIMQFVMNYGALGILAFWIFLDDRRRTKADEKRAEEQREDKKRIEGVVERNTLVIQQFTAAISRMEGSLG